MAAFVVRRLIGMVFVLIAVTFLTYLIFVKIPGGDPAQVAPAMTAAAANANDGLANRKVRTVTVRPDGTIVSSDDSVAGAAKLPVDRLRFSDSPLWGRRNPRFSAGS